MGIIIRNGIEYGGKTFEDMTYEEYQALPEAVKNDGAIRHIIDRDINHAFIDDTKITTDKTWSSNEINARLNVIDITSKCTKITGVDDLKVTRCGNVVHVYFRYVGNSAQEVITGLPKASTKYFIAPVFDIASPYLPNKGTFWVRETGVTSIYLSGAVTNSYVSFTYICVD